MEQQQGSAPAVTPGVQTSEYRLANRASWIGIASIVVGIIVELAAELVEYLTPLAAQLPNARWLGIVLLVCGAIVKVAATFGYSKSRAAVKAAATSTTKALVLLVGLGLAGPAFAQESAIEGEVVAHSEFTPEEAKLLAALAGNLAEEAPAAPAPAARRFGGCSASGFFCAGPSMSLSLLTYNLKRQTFENSLTLGAGYGATFFANQWYATGASVHGALRSTDNGGTLLLSIVGSFAEYARVGIGREIIGATGTAEASSSTFLTGGFGLDF